MVRTFGGRIMKAENLFERIFGEKHPLSGEDSKKSTREDTDLGVR